MTNDIRRIVPVTRIGGLKHYRVEKYNEQTHSWDTESTPPLYSREDADRLLAIRQDIENAPEKNADHLLALRQGGEATYGTEV